MYDAVQLFIIARAILALQATQLFGGLYLKWTCNGTRCDWDSFVKTFEQKIKRRT